jgi:two-component system, chemotaxis family, CheB/CheR fusion protein
VQGANPAFYQFFQVEPAHTEHRLLFALEDSQWDIPALRTLLEELLPTNHSFTDYIMESTFPRIGRKTLLLNAHRIDHVPLILLAMSDITALTQAAHEKQQMLSQREEFMAMASHELKTPVTSLKGFTQVLLSRFTKAGDERSATLLAKMDAQLDKLVHLISELLDVTTIEAGQLAWHTQSFDLEALVQEIVEEVGYTAERHQIRIEGAISGPISGDRERLGQVLTNLLTNAIKYSPQATAILVAMVADRESATISVQDFGIGIASEKLTHVFERFYRVSDGEHETFPGLGLGLFISAQIVKRHGGRMWVESQPGVSSTFSFTVPLVLSPEAGTLRQKEEEEHHA